MNIMLQDWQYMDALSKWLIFSSIYGSQQWVKATYIVMMLRNPHTIAIQLLLHRGGRLLRSSA